MYFIFIDQNENFHQSHSMFLSFNQFHFMLLISNQNHGMRMIKGFILINENETH
jgi:hypothetical protein